MKNLTLANITEACQGTYHGDESLLNREAAGVTIDSRKVKKDFLFVAINGERFNAHTFIPDTIEKGALCVVYTKTWAIQTIPIFLWRQPGRHCLTLPNSTVTPLM